MSADERDNRPPNADEPLPDWFSTFFDRAANDFWETAVPDSTTTAEVELLSERLAIQPCARIIDIAAGRGRLTLPLDYFGASVTAVDQSVDGLDHLRQRAAEQGVAVDIVQGDMRRLPVIGPFEGGYCMGNSFGYFDLHGVEQFLDEVERVLRPGARFVLESATVADCFLAQMADHTHHDFGGVLINGHHRYDPDDHRVISTLRLDDGTSCVTRVMDQLVLTRVQIDDFLQSRGLRTIDRLGSADGEPFVAESNSLIVVAERR